MNYHHETTEERRKRSDAIGDRVLLGIFKIALVLMLTGMVWRYGAEEGRKEAFKEFKATGICAKS
jgi:hypothetical protein